MPELEFIWGRKMTCIDRTASPWHLYNLWLLKFLSTADCDGTLISDGVPHMLLRICRDWKNEVIFAPRLRCRLMQAGGTLTACSIPSPVTAESQVSLRRHLMSDRLQMHLCTPSQLKALVWINWLYNYSIYTSLEEINHFPTWNCSNEATFHTIGLVYFKIGTLIVFRLRLNIFIMSNCKSN